MTTDIKDCYFYHVMDIPGIGVVGEEWDLRENIDSYLGKVDFRGKRALDVGTASGQLAFYMERRGADVTAYDLDPSFNMDIAPSRYGYKRHFDEHKGYIAAVNNGFKMAQSALDSKVVLRHGSVYDMPADIGPVDICVFGSILLHLRDPYLALQNATRLTQETCIVAEPLWEGSKRWMMRLLSRFAGPYQVFVPNYTSPEPQATWWHLSPAIVQTYLAALGFEKSEVSYHQQLYKGKQVPLFTVVATRTQPIEQ